MNRHEARLKRAVTYNTGEPCDYGHMSDRYTQSGQCIECANMQQRMRRFNGMLSVRLRVHHQYAAIIEYEVKKANTRRFTSQTAITVDIPPPDTVISKEQAQANGDKYYFTGKACVAGHVSQRYVKGGACVACRRNKSKNLDQFDTLRFELHPNDAPDIVALVKMYNELAGFNDDPVVSINPRRLRGQQQRQNIIGGLDRKKADQLITSAKCCNDTQQLRSVLVEFIDALVTK